MNEREVTLPMQPGEPSWASWKCGGGPHTSDFEPPRAPERPVAPLPLKPAVKAPLTRMVIVHDVSDAVPTKQKTVEVGIPDERMANMLP